MKNIVFFTGAGISKDSGLNTFRDADGYWDQYRIEDVCTHEAILRNRELVINFYNERRKEILEKQPNAAHLAIAQFEKEHPELNVQVVTQNIDDLHERAGSRHITHLHGEITKLRSSRDELATVPLKGWKQDMEARHPDGSLLRPYIVFFGEGVPYMDQAIQIARKADVFVVVGTSLAVYPAASLLNYVKENVPVYVVDPGQPDFGYYANMVREHIRKRAAEGVPELCKRLV